MGRHGRCREADENHDSIATGVAAHVDVKIGLPIVKRPNVASLIDHDICLTHHWGEARRRWWWTVQRLSVVQQHLASGGRYRVAGRRRYWIAQLFAGTPGRRVNAAKLGESAGSEIAARLEGTEIGDPQVVLTVHCYAP
jgi:hypothetical protein